MTRIPDLFLQMQQLPQADQSMATNDESKMNDQSKTSVTKTKGHKTKTKATVEKKPEPWVFTGTKIEQTTAATQQ